MATAQLSMFTLDPEADDDAHPGQATGHYIGTCPSCTKTVRQSDGRPRLHACPMRYRRARVLITMRPIVGTYNGRVRCGSKCQQATGPDCECSCSGTNHGTYA